MSYWTIAGMQLALAQEDNLAAICSKLEQAKQRFPWIDMFVLSELCVHGPATRHAETFPSQVEQTLQAVARTLGVWIITGSQFEAEQDKIYNTSSVINSDGDIVQRYRKLFPFTPYETGVSAGEEFCVFDTPAGRIGLAICYDLWFPEVARALVCLGAEALIYPTMTGTIDRQAELDMAKATAAMQQAYVIAVNGAGEQGNGQSIVVGPNGRPLHQATSQEEIFPLELDFNRVRRSRERGIDNLGQPLKSFRDSTLKYPQYSEQKTTLPGLQSLGPLKVPD